GADRAGHEFHGPDRARTSGRHLSERKRQRSIAHGSAADPDHRRVLDVLAVTGGANLAAADHTPRDATPITRARNPAVLGTLPFDEPEALGDGGRGFIGSLPDVEITNAQGRVVWSLRDYAFLAEETAPATVNPSLWRQARLNMHHGLFRVTDRVYQIRGFDISNMTIIEGERGLIVIDALISTEVARAGLDLYFIHRPRRPVAAVIYTHSHVDHFGG